MSQSPACVPFIVPRVLIIGVYEYGSPPPRVDPARLSPRLVINQPNEPAAK
jgi:hypothetical protein